MKNIKFSLAWQILFAMVLGILLGSYLHYHSDSRDWLVVNLLSPAGDIFIHLIKMIVVPIVISTLVVGIAGVGDAKQLGRIGAKTIIYFEVITTVAIILGITLANVFQPGAGVDMSQLATVDISKYQSTTEAVQSSSHGIMGTILSLVPTNIVASMAKGEMLPIIFFSVLFGLGLSSLPATHREPLVTVFRSISETMFKVTHMVMRYAPVGVFALIAVTVANFGFSSLWPLAKLVLLVHLSSSPVPGWICRSWRPSISRNIRALRKRYKAVPTALWARFCRWCRRTLWRRWRKAKCCRSSSSRCCLVWGFHPCPRRIVNRW